MRKLLGYSLLLAGCVLFFYPAANTWRMEKETERYIESFDQRDICKEDESDAKNEDALYQEMKSFNESIYEDGQKDFCDAWSYTQSPVSLNGLEEGKFGYIEIEAMDLKLPLYVGATEENLSKGAAILGQTSYPIGGQNTNSVIAAHRGYHGAPFFREIERLEVGDLVKVTNPWETLYYKVTEIKIIKPNDSDQVRIQEGKEMITLCTCHPYRSNGKMRYCVYCERAKDEDRRVDMEEEYDDDWDDDFFDEMELVRYPDNDITLEKIIYHIGMISVVLLLGSLLIGACKRLYGERRKSYD